MKKKPCNMERDDLPILDDYPWTMRERQSPTRLNCGGKKQRGARPKWKKELAGENAGRWRLDWDKMFVPGSQPIERRRVAWNGRAPYEGETNQDTAFKVLVR